MTKNTRVRIINPDYSYPSFNQWVEKHTPQLYQKHLASTDRRLALHGVVGRLGEIGHVRDYRKYNGTNLVVMETDDRVIVIDEKGVEQNEN